MPPNSGLAMYQEVLSSYRCGKIQKLPLWHTAMRAIPPSQPMQKTSIKNSKKTFSDLPFEKKLTSEERKHYEYQLSTIVSVIPQKKNGYVQSPEEKKFHEWELLGVQGRRMIKQAQRQAPRNWQTPVNARLLREVSSKPAEPVELVFPEDALRERFYSDHPFELVLRPQTLVDPQPKQGQLVAAEPDYGEPLEERKNVSGEDVVQRQLFLISKGNTVDEAYKLALQEFYKIRTIEEQNEKKSISEINAIEPFDENDTRFGSDNMKRRYPLNSEAWVQEEKALSTSGDGNIASSKVLQSDKKSIFDYGEFSNELK